MQNAIVCDEVLCEQEKTTNASAQWKFKHPETLFENWLFEKKSEFIDLKKFPEECKFRTRIMAIIGRFIFYNLVPAEKQNYMRNLLTRET